MTTEMLGRGMTRVLARRRAPWIATAALLALAPPARAQTAAPAKPVSSAKTGPVVLLRPGQAPLAPLRLALSKTAVEKGEFSFVTTVELEGPSGPQKVAPPKMSIPTTATHAAAAVADAVAVNVKFGAARVEGPNAEAVEAKLRGAGMNFGGIACEYVVTSRGLVASSSVIVGPDVAPTLRQMAEQSKSTLDLAMLPFPDEPVGVGARWQQDGSAQAAGMAVQMTSTYELVERTKTFVRVKRSVVQKATPGVIQVPGSDTKVDLLSFDGAGDGELRQDLDQVLPSKWTLDLRIRLSMKAQGQVIKQTLTSLTTGGAKLTKK